MGGGKEQYGERNETPFVQLNERLSIWLTRQRNTVCKQIVLTQFQLLPSLTFPEELHLLSLLCLCSAVVCSTACWQAWLLFLHCIIKVQVQDDVMKSFSSSRKGSSSWKRKIFYVKKNRMQYLKFASIYLSFILLCSSVSGTVCWKLHDLTCRSWLLI